MRKFILCFSIIIISCQKNSIINTNCDTAHDPFSDITYLNNCFYSTNNDNSMNAGPQIFLYKISNDGKYLDDIFNLNMNGQGYLAITNDGNNLYLQSRDFNSIIKCSTVGEIYYNVWDITNSTMQGCGICYVSNVDSLCVLTRDYQKSNHYSLLFVDKNNPYAWEVKASAEIKLLNNNTGAFAIEIIENDLYILGQDTTNTDVLIKSDLSLNVIEFKSLNTDSTTGLCKKESTLYFSYLNKIIVESDN